MTPNPNEALAAALYAEHHRVCYPNVLVYPWEELCCTMPGARDGWLAVADMAVLNLCEAVPVETSGPGWGYTKLGRTAYDTYAMNRGRGGDQNDGPAWEAVAHAVLMAAASVYEQPPLIEPVSS